MAPHRELEGFRDHAQEFARAGVRLLALSRQTTDYQRELVTRLAAAVSGLERCGRAFRRCACACRAFTTGGETYLKRLTLFIDDGRIAHVFYPVRDPAAPCERGVALAAGMRRRTGLAP